MSIMTNLFSRSYSFLKNIIVKDKSWSFMTIFNAKYRGLLKMNLCCLLHGRKVILCVWLDHLGIIHFEFLNRNQAHNACLYSQQLQCVEENLLEKSSRVNDNQWSRSARITREKYWSVLSRSLFLKTLYQVISIFFIL